ncbi:hypothetical protein K443DRAFT_15781 [Laccaria amethystina LaAM-08-1]|uniref:Uncharacterized protein n=1 Tax=Laccaria amethystina LaAM-08-1 TaxID=1095629 RepID=A0A0C9WKX1_9AGAR|nr:hypothetical protein K443DRAFT_15781 [Laccaria amethystina LaAM-08-1]
MRLSETSNTHDPGWIWYAVPTPSGASVAPTPTNKPVLPKTSKKEVVVSEPPPPITIIIAKDRVPRVKPPPVKKAEQSRPGAPPLKQRKWWKFTEEYHPEGKSSSYVCQKLPLVVFLT